MMVQTELIGLLGPIFDTRFYPFGSEDSPVPPYGTFFRITAAEEATLDENGGTDNPVNTRLQVDVWALSYTEAQEMAAAVKAALKGWAVENIVLLEMDGHEKETKLHRVTLDISTWHL